MACGRVLMVWMSTSLGKKSITKVRGLHGFSSPFRGFSELVMATMIPTTVLARYSSLRASITSARCNMNGRRSSVKTQVVDYAIRGQSSRYFYYQYRIRSTAQHSPKTFTTPRLPLPSSTSIDKMPSSRCHIHIHCPYHLYWGVSRFMIMLTSLVSSQSAHPGWPHAPHPVPP
jgi:hypothetical protein